MDNKFGFIEKVVLYLLLFISFVHCVSIALHEGTAIGWLLIFVLTGVIVLFGYEIHNSR